MSEFNPALVFLANIYVDGFSNRQTTEVYANDVMQVSIFVSVNYNGNSDGIEDKIKDYVQDNVVIYRLKNNGDKEEVDWDYSDASNGFPHDIEYSDRGETASDIRTPFYFTVPVGSVGKHSWIAKMEEQETSIQTPVTINARKFETLTDGSQFEFLKLVHRASNTLSVLRYKPGVFPETQRVMKSYDHKGIRFTKTGGNCWVSRFYTTTLLSAIFLDYKDDHINVAKDGVLYQIGEYETTKSSLEWPIYAKKGCEKPSTFTSSEIEKAWAQGFVIVQSASLDLYNELWPGAPPIFHVNPFTYPTYKFQDNFGNIIEIEFDWFKEDWDDWSVKRAIVRYP